MSSKKTTPIRPLLMKSHSLLASFFLPMALLFLITGVLYTLGIEGGAKTTKLQVPLANSVGGSLPETKSLVSQALAGAHLAAPSGPASLRDGKRGWQFVWGGPAGDASLQPSKDPAIGDLTYRENSLLRRAMNLHKAKGGALFRWLAVAWGTGLLLLLISGSWLALQVKALRNLSLIAMAVGLISFLIATLAG